MKLRDRFRLSEQDRAFLLSLSYATGIILFWRGIWEGSLDIPILSNPWVSLFIGLAILTLTGWIYREFDAFSLRASKLLNTLTNVLHDTKRGTQHKIFYYDEVSKKHHSFSAHHVKKVEQHHLIIEKDGREVFIPLHRISHITRGNSKVWYK